MSNASSGKPSNNTGKVAGGIGATILAVIFGVARYSDDAARVGMRGARPIINNIDNVGVKLAPHADDLGKVTGTGAKAFPGDAPGVFNNLDEAGNVAAVVGDEGSTATRVGGGSANKTGEAIVDAVQKGAELIPDEEENSER